jgi:hypothetical protein
MTTDEARELKGMRASRLKEEELREPQVLDEGR